MRRVRAHSRHFFVRNRERSRGEQLFFVADIAALFMLDAMGCGRDEQRDDRGCSEPDKQENRGSLRPAERRSIDERKKCYGAACASVGPVAQ